MAASARSTEATSITSESTTWEPKRGSVVSGDLLVCFFFPRRTAGLSISEAPSGWTQRKALQTGFCSGFCYTKVAGGSEPEKYTWKLSQVETGQCVIVALKEAIAFIAANAADTTGTTHETGTVKSGGAGNVFLACHFIDGASPTWTGAGTELVESPNGGIPSSIAAYLAVASGEETAGHTGTSSGSGEGVSMIVSLESEPVQELKPDSDESTTGWEGSYETLKDESDATVTKATLA